MYKIVNNYSNYVVVSYYLEIIRQSLLEKGESVDYISSLKEAKKNDIIIISHPLQAGMALLKGYKNIIVWVQGLIAEESYMRNRSELRRWVLNSIEKYSLKKAKKVFFVSEKMRDFIQSKTKIDFSTNSFIMPCFNTDLHRECFVSKEKYKKNVFTYVGSLSKWQCFEQTLDLYKNLEDLLPDPALKVFTFTPQEAEEIIKKKGIKCYTVDSVPNEELPNRLKDVKYGFILREDNMVNAVATPTKISTYLSCGVIPIFSTVLDSFFTESKKLRYCIPINDIKDTSPILEFSKQTINNEEVIFEYQNIFNNYFCADKYIAEIKDFI